MTCEGRALVLVLDRSGSMMGGPLAAAKDAVVSAAKALPLGACFEVLAFDSTVADVVPLAPVDPVTTAARVERLSAGGGTEFVAPLERAAASMRRVRGPTLKRVVFLTDGQAPKESVLDAVAHLRLAGATLTTIALGSSTDFNFLHDMADAGHGTVHLVADPNSLAAVFVHEATAP